MVTESDVPILPLGGGSVPESVMVLKPPHGEPCNLDVVASDLNVVTVRPRMPPCSFRDIHPCSPTVLAPAPSPASLLPLASAPMRVGTTWSSPRTMFVMLQFSALLGGGALLLRLQVMNLFMVTGVRDETKEIGKLCKMFEDVRACAHI